MNWKRSTKGSRRLASTGSADHAFLLHLCAILLLPVLALAQEKTLKWGDIPRAGLELASFPNDTNATAVVLGDIGRVNFADDFALIFTRHRRIKILSKAGYNWGDYAISYYAKDHIQSISGLRLSGISQLHQHDRQG